MRQLGPPSVARRSGALLALAVLLGSLPLGAEERAPYLHAYTGIGVTRASDLRIRQPTVDTDLVIDAVRWEHRSLSTSWDRDSIPYVGVRSGFFLGHPGWLSVSAEVLHFKVFAETDKRYRVTGSHRGVPVDAVAPMAEFVSQYQVSNGVNMVLGNLSAHRRLGRSSRFPMGQVDVYGGGGAGVTIPFTRATIGGASSGQYEWGRLATQAFGGLAYSMSPRWSLFAEYKLTATTVDGAIPDGQSESPLRTHHLAFGLGYEFE